jgi:hypothetical protein
MFGHQNPPKDRRIIPVFEMGMQSPIHFAEALALHQATWRKEHFAWPAQATHLPRILRHGFRARRAPARY